MGRLLVSFAVTPYGGVWIEIYLQCTDLVLLRVTPYGGVWIEITRDYHCPPSIVSRLMEACGLK